MTQQAKTNYIVHSDTVYEEVDNPLFTTYKQCSVQKKEPKPVWKGAKLPWELWVQAVAWCQVTQEKFKSEALIYLFYDTSKPSSPWQLWFVPQITNGMTVKANTNHANYKLERKMFPDLQFGSLHHHCTTGAFASGTDKDDEVDRDGFHFTIGNIGSNRHSTHFRFSLNKSVTVYPAEEWIEYSSSLNMLPESVKAVAHKELVHTPLTADQLKSYDFTTTLKNISKPQVKNNFQNNARIGGWKQPWNNKAYDHVGVVQQQNLGIVVDNNEYNIAFATLKNRLIHWTMYTVNEFVSLTTEQESHRLLIDIGELIEDLNVWGCLKKNVANKLSNQLITQSNDNFVTDFDIKFLKVILKNTNWQKKDMSVYNKFETLIMEHVLDTVCNIQNTPDFITNDEGYILLHKKKLIAFSLMYMNTLLN